MTNAPHHSQGCRACIFRLAVFSDFVSKRLSRICLALRLINIGVARMCLLWSVDDTYLEYRRELIVGYCRETA